MAIEGSASAEIDAPIDEVCAIAATARNSPNWQPEIEEADGLEEDDDGNQVLVHTATDAKVRTLHADLRFSYDEPHGLTWTQRRGPQVDR